MTVCWLEWQKWLDYVSIIIQQASSGCPELSIWEWQGFLRVRSIQSLLNPRLRMNTPPFLSHSVSQNKSQGHPRFMDWCNRFHLLMGGDVKSHGKGSISREVWTLGLFLKFIYLGARSSCSDYLCVLHHTHNSVAPNANDRLWLPLSITLNSSERTSFIHWFIH